MDFQLSLVLDLFPSRWKEMLKVMLLFSQKRNKQVIEQLLHKNKIRWLNLTMNLTKFLVLIISKNLLLILKAWHNFLWFFYIYKLETHYYFLNINLANDLSLVLCCFLLFLFTKSEKKWSRLNLKLWNISCIIWSENHQF